MKVGIVTVTFNSQAVLPDFLSSLERQTHSDFVLYVIDNASTDKTCAHIAQNMPQAVLLRNQENLGFAAGTNQGIRRALAHNCDAVLLINNDVSFESDLLQRLIEGQREHKAPMTVPMMYYAAPMDRIWAAGGALHTWAGCRAIHRGQDERDVGQFGEPCPISFAPFCCILIHRSVFEQIGLLDEQYFAYVEDADFLYRCRQNNIKLWFIPTARLWHKVSSLTGPVSAFGLHYGARNRSYFLRKHMLPGFRMFFDLLYLGYYVGRYLARVDDLPTCQVRLKGWAEGRRILPTPAANLPLAKQQ